MRRLLLLLPSLALGCVALNAKYEQSGTEGAEGSADATSQGATSEPSGTSHGSVGTSLTSTGSGSSGIVPDDKVLFVDERWEGEFGEALEHEDLHWDEGGVMLVEGAAGAVLESRIFDAGGPVRWSSVRWQPRGPYLLPLDLDAAPYDQGDTSLEALQLLLHLDEPSRDDGDPVTDALGERPGVWRGTATTAEAGVFARALSHDDTELVSRIDFENAVEPGLGDFTWTMWFRNEGCQAGPTLIALDAPNNQAAAGTVLAFMACGNFASNCPDNSPGHATVQMNHVGGQLVRACSETLINDGSWHHLAIRRTVADQEQQLDLFVDGRLEDTTVSDTIVDVSVHEQAMSPETFTIAGGNAAQFPGPGTYDEVALWNRGLQDREVENLYNRGVRIARFQVRACDTADCADSDFVGPGADLDGGFLDPGTNAGHVTPLEPYDLHGRYFQYRFQLRRPVGVESPTIESVEVVGYRE